MKLARTFTLIFGTLVALLVAPPLATADVPAGNLILNPGAEIGQAADDSVQSFEPPSWTSFYHNVTQVHYGTLGFPIAQAGQGTAFFAGGPDTNPNSAHSEMTQNVDLSGAQAEIDAGHVGVTLAGELGGYADQNDNATVTVQFWHDPENSLGSIQIGPVTAADRGNVTGLLHQTISGVVPVGTTYAVVNVTFTRVTGTYNDGYADNLSLTLTAQVVVTPPANMSPPALSGSPEEARQMFCSTGSWTGSEPIVYSYQWLRDGSPIAGATGQSYTVVAQDVTRTLSCQVTASNNAGSVSATSPGVYMTPTPPRNLIAPRITGPSLVGQTLSCEPGRWTGSPTYSYKWYRGGGAIPRATGSTYRTVDDDTYLSIACSVTATNTAGAGGAVSNQIIPQPSPIGAKYISLGGRRGFLGAPLRAESNTFGGRYRVYQGGSIYNANATGAHVVLGLIRAKWLALRGTRGFLGYPKTDELAVRANGRYNEFQGGAIFWSPPTGAHEVHGLIKEHWYQLGAINGVTGFPVTDELVTPDHLGRHSEFQYASIYWSPRSGAHEVHGVVRQVWGHNLSFWGYPLTDEVATHYRARGAYNDFQGGSIHWSAHNGIESSVRCPHWACKDGHARHTCNPRAVRDELRYTENERLSAFDRATGEIGTILKRLHVGAKGWGSRACFVHNAVGRLVRSPQWSTDNIWTADLELVDFNIEGVAIYPLRKRFIRLEIEPRTGHSVGYANAYVDSFGPGGNIFGCVLPLCGSLPRKLFRGSRIPAGTLIRFGGLIVIDSDHGFLEVHPDKEFSVG